MKKSLLVLLVLTAISFSQEMLAVQAYDEQPDNESSLTLRVKVVNNSPHTFENVELRYYFAPKQGKQVVFENYYLAGGGGRLGQDGFGTILFANFDSGTSAWRNAQSKWI